MRYRQDKKNKRRLTTVEIVVDDAPLLSPDEKGRALFPHPNQSVLVKIAWREEQLRQRVKEAGGKWLPGQKLWQLPYRKVIALGLRQRIQER